MKGASRKFKWDWDRWFFRGWFNWGSIFGRAILRWGRNGGVRGRISRGVLISFGGLAFFGAGGRTFGSSRKLDGDGALGCFLIFTSVF